MPKPFFEWRNVGNHCCQVDAGIECQKIVVLQNLSHNVTCTSTEISISAVTQNKRCKVVSWCGLLTARESEFELFCNMLSLSSWFVLLHTKTCSTHLNRLCNVVLYVNKVFLQNSYFFYGQFVCLIVEWPNCVLHILLIFCDFLWSVFSLKQRDNPLIVLKIALWRGIMTRIHIAVVKKRVLQH